MLFVTNRRPSLSPRSRQRTIKFDLQDTDVSRYLYFCERDGENEYREILSGPFFDRLKNLPDHTQVLLYVHGFNNNMEGSVFPRAEKLQALFHAKEQDLVLVVPLIWPCDDDSIVQIADDYWDDRRAADASAPGFARLLGKFDQWRRHSAQQADPCYRRINILAHSMGNRVLRGALSDWAIKDSSNQMPLIFRNVFMVAADVQNETLEKGRPGEYIPDSARNVFVYYAYDDYAMPASKVANVGEKTLSRRMGMTGPEDLDKTPKNVFEIDCSSFNNSFDTPAGHSYFTVKDDEPAVESPLIPHMYHAIKYGRPQSPDRRIELNA